MFCPKCGTKIQEGANFCINCGLAISENVQPDRSLNTEQIIREERKYKLMSWKELFMKNKKKVFLSAGLLVLVIAAISFLYLHLTMCAACNGRGHVHCSYCENGYISCPSCKEGKVSCKQCLGLGSLGCSSCNESGYMICSQCQGEGKISNGKTI